MDLPGSGAGQTLTSWKGNAPIYHEKQKTVQRLLVAICTIASLAMSA